MKSLLLAVLLLIATTALAADPTCYNAPASFSGAKFIARYGLTSDDFYAINGQICLRPGLVLSDNPPLFEAPDAPAVVQHSLAKSQIDTQVALRAVVALVLNEFNAHALKINAILDAVDAATSLADLKTRIAAIPDYPQRTQQQLINAIKTAIDAGNAD